MWQMRYKMVGLLAMAAALWPCTLHAASQQLACVLNNAGGGAPSAQNEPVTVIFDDDAKTLQAQRGGQSYSLNDVSISNVAISGDVGAVSFSIDRSSLGVVWQQYGADKVTIEYGRCRQNSAAAPPSK